MEEGAVRSGASTLRNWAVRRREKKGALPSREDALRHGTGLWPELGEPEMESIVEAAGFDEWGKK